MARDIVVSGADGFLGHKLAVSLKDQGHNVHGTVLRKESLDRLPSGVQGHVIDLADENSVAGLAGDLPNVSAVIHTAGGFRYGSVADTSEADLQFLLNANFVSAFQIAKCFGPRLARQEHGRMVYVSSAATLNESPANMAAYVASKAALNALVQSLAAEYRKAALTVNAVMPTIIDTRANREAMPDADTSEWVTPEQLIDVMTYLLRPESGAISGSLIKVAAHSP